MKTKLLAFTSLGFAIIISSASSLY